MADFLAKVFDQADFQMISNTALARSLRDPYELASKPCQAFLPLLSPATNQMYKSTNQMARKIRYVPIRPFAPYGERQYIPESLHKDCSIKAVDDRSIIHPLAPVPHVKLVRPLESSLELKHTNTCFSDRNTYSRNRAITDSTGAQ
jgi:hypothetical protein